MELPVVPAPLLPTAPEPPTPLLGRGTSSIETTVLFGLALAPGLEAAALPPCELPLAVSEVAPVELPWVVLPELLD
jgi:hypothetical protein